MKSPFLHAAVLVLGDLMLDIYRYGQATRISPEAPVPVVRLDQTLFQPGGAAHVAMNLATLGVSTSLCGPIGSDSHGQTLKHLLQNQGINGFYWDNLFPTITKERIVAKGQQMIRLDQEPEIPPMAFPENFPSEVWNASAQVWVCSDYGKGCLSPAALEKIYHQAASSNIPVVTDPKMPDWNRYLGTTWITPNWQELCTALGTKANPEPEYVTNLLETAAQRWHIPHILVTLSEKGMAWWHNGKVHFFPAEARQVFDVSGAGDTVVAVLAAGLAKGMPPEHILPLANKAAGLVVALPGTVPVQWDWLV